MQNKQEIILSLENTFSNALQASGLGSNGEAIVDALICGTLLSVIEQSELEKSALILRRLKDWEDLNTFADMLDKLPVPKKEEFRASLYKLFQCFHNNGGKAFEELSRLHSARTAEQIAALRTTFLNSINGVLDSAILALPLVQSIELTHEEVARSADASWRAVLTEEVRDRARSDAQLSRELFTKGLFEAIDNAARVLTSEPDNIASYNSYISEAEAILRNVEMQLSIALDYKGHHNLSMHYIIGCRLKADDATRLFLLVNEIEKKQIEAFLADHTNQDLQYIYQSIKDIYGGSISNWCMHHSNFTYFQRAIELGIEGVDSVNADLTYNVLASCVRLNNFDKIKITSEFLKANNLALHNLPMGALISKLISSDNEVAACHLIDITADLEQVDPDTKSTLLMQAALKYQVSVVRKLLEKGANVNAKRRSDGKTICHILADLPKATGRSAELNNEKVYALLSIFQANQLDVNIKDNADRTAIMYSLGRSDKITISMKLIEMGALLNTRNPEHCTALQQVFYSKTFSARIVNRMIQAGGNVNELANTVDFGTLNSVDIVVLAIKSRWLVLEKLERRVRASC